MSQDDQQAVYTMEDLVCQVTSYLRDANPGWSEEKIAREVQKKRRFALWEVISIFVPGEYNCDTLRRKCTQQKVEAIKIGRTWWMFPGHIIANLNRHKF